MSRLVVPAIAAALFMLAFAPAESHAATAKACDLLTSQAAGSLAGGQVDPPMAGGDTVCMYAHSGGETSASLMLMPVTEGYGAKYTQIAINGPIKGELLSGVGDQAFFATQPGDVNVVIAFSHLKMLTLTVKRKLDPGLKAAMVQSMKQIVAKL